MKSAVWGTFIRFRGPKALDDNHGSAHADPPPTRKQPNPRRHFPAKNTQQIENSK